MFIALYTVANLGLWLAVYAPALVTLSIRMRETAGENAVNAYGLIVGVGALFAMFGNPLFGRLSDRSRSRFGRRRPFFIGGMIVGVAALAVIGFATSIPVILVAWCVAQLAYNAAIATLTAVLADEIPAAQRGKVAGLAGVCNYGSLAVAAYVAAWFSFNTALMFIAPAVIGLVLVLVFAPVLKERRTSEALAPLSFKTFITTFWVSPLKHPDFAWAWWSRFFIVLAWMCLLTYQSFFLIDRLGYTNDNVATALGTASLVLVAGIVIGSSGGGWLSDKLQRRKIFIVVATFIAAIGFPVIAFADSIGAFYLGVVVVGLGIGIHMSVDLALIADLLPDADEAGKDLGVFNIANALPQSLAPVFAAILFGVLGSENYTALYISAAVFALLGAVAVRFIKGSR
ncbi:MFS transporter [Frigoribacterium sp. Leaf172]|uniref:MFS transporter n=1 Tax=Frigoribacterium sp. Leaf172 TaxID=1736285 RepID=UPI0006FA8920|nr:MFS transporter [Frigoribacterium sp. Leaf172]KQR66021.1 hypothetical protein ASF89_02335 [Frigoribacterium sp. Leaf172]